MNRDSDGVTLDSLLPHASSKHQTHTFSLTSNRLHDLHHNQHHGAKTSSQGATLLRTLGLGIVNASLRWRQKQEPPKVALRQSRATAVTRASVHLVPVSASIALIALNTHTLYVGIQNELASILQFFAKALEMLLQASICTVAFAYIRHEMLSENDTPFGALFSALQITNLSYLWSLEFWAAATAPSFQGRRRYSFVVFMTISVLLAATVGPSIAVALIPRLSSFSAKDVPILLNCTDQQLYPNLINTDGVYRGCLSANDDIYLGWNCPNTDWESFAELSAFQVQLTTRKSIRQLSVCSYGRPCRDETIATTQVAQMADALVAGANAWASYSSRATGALGKFRSHSNVVHSARVKQPYATANCLANRIYGREDTRNLSFSINQSWSYMYNLAREKNRSHLLDGLDFTWESHISRTTIWNKSTQTDHCQILWTELPRSIFPNTTIGAIVVRPRRVLNPGYIQTAACLVSTAWGSSVLNTTGSTNTSTLLTVQSSDFEAPWHDVQSWPQDRVHISPEWAKILVPTLRSRNDDDTVAHELVQQFSIPTEIGGQTWLSSRVPQFQDSAPGEPNIPLVHRRTYNYEILFASLLVAGMARTGTIQYTKESAYPLLGSSYNHIPLWAHDGQSQISMQTDVEGQGYNMKGTPVNLAVAILSIYCIYALAHIFYASLSGLSSNSWDSIGELTALAINSNRTAILDHTSAGIDTMHTFKRPMRIRASGDDHLEIAFSEDDKSNKDLCTVKRNFAY